MGRYSAEFTVVNTNVEDALTFVGGGRELGISSEIEESADIETQCKSSLYDQTAIETPTDMQTLRQKLVGG